MSESRNAENSRDEKLRRYLLAGQQSTRQTQLHLEVPRLMTAKRSIGAMMLSGV